MPEEVKAELKKKNLTVEFNEIVSTELGTVNEIIKGGSGSKFLDFSVMTDMDETTSERSFISHETNTILHSRRGRGVKSSFNHRYRLIQQVEPFKKYKKRRIITFGRNKSHPPKQSKDNQTEVKRSSSATLLPLRTAPNVNTKQNCSTFLILHGHKMKLFSKKNTRKKLFGSHQMKISKPMSLMDRKIDG